MLKIIKNSKRTPCSHCKGVHDYINKPTDGHPCDLPAAYENDVARRLAPMVANGTDDVVGIPVGTDVILGDKDRKLPKREDPNLRTFSMLERLA